MGNLAGGGPQQGYTPQSQTFTPLQNMPTQPQGSGAPQRVPYRAQGIAGFG